ncbi:hypothetical protein KY336_02235 [Candidatus Woesearchaeota archaeon]|nr:hypothetical protein [Candidatus Woesearchaeota archaeon]
MIYGLFVHPQVCDPSAGDPCFGRLPNGELECSEEGHAMQRYLENRKIIAELEKTYEMRYMNNFWFATLRVTKSDPLDMYNFMITNFPPREDEQAFVEKRRQKLAKLLAWKSDEDKEKIKKAFKEAEGDLTEKIYEPSINCLKEILESNPVMKIIVYTGTYPVMRSRCEEMGAYVVNRGCFGLEAEIKEIKRIIESGPWPRRKVV